jgi:hypothetical protein
MILPAQAGLPVTTGADTVIVLPQLSVTFGGVGAEAAAGQATVDTVLAGITTTGGAIVVVCVHV